MRLSTVTFNTLKSVAVVSGCFNVFFNIVNVHIGTFLSSSVRFEPNIFSCFCGYFQTSAGSFTGSAWTCAALGEASAPVWLSSRSWLLWLSICSSCTPWISKSRCSALRTSSIIRSPPLPGQGRLHRARVAQQTSYPQTSWMLSEEASRAFFFQRRRSFQI